ncbi:pectinesterase family protein [Halopiger xanaduensis]|uniref:Pectinesterase n=1 Tax=Halopiger xanaduensis (strain DSM 18323 / JCM 14033 / SH-6) TaxID=797210 RepID=F8D8M9_HALXS|nr:pectinesterase family protein [Halopiger xanaduensis]AEH36781.1 Pectinesterase [Halopiger xanaduensis SH-6]
MTSSEGGEYDCVVDPDGSGDYERIQAAIDDAKSFPRERIAIFLKEGVYEEKVTVHSWNPKIDLIGESADGTVIAHDDHFERIDRGRNSTFFTYTLKVCGNDFRARNLTVRNDAGPEKGQAVALHVEADRAVFENCRFVGNQDTVYAAGEGSRQYFDDCYLEGTTDFVFGGATAVFDNCEVHSKADSYVTAASTPRTEPFGFVFDGCTLTAEPNVSEVYLGRPWRDHAHVTFLRSHMDDHILPAGWHDWSRPDVVDDVTYAEYENRGPGSRTDDRVPWSETLSPAEAERYAAENVLLRRDSPKSDWYWHRAIC